jgi:hypothetical protein
MRLLWSMLAHTGRTLWEILRELGDQAAYERYLRLHGCGHSAEAWRRFTDERMRARFARPKCC